jgi:hypothetical protein
MSERRQFMLWTVKPLWSAITYWLTKNIIRSVVLESSMKSRQFFNRSRSTIIVREPRNIPLPCPQNPSFDLSWTAWIQSAFCFSKICSSITLPSVSVPPKCTLRMWFSEKTNPYLFSIFPMHNFIFLHPVAIWLISVIFVLVPFITQPLETQ